MSIKCQTYSSPYPCYFCTSGYCDAPKISINSDGTCDTYTAESPADSRDVYQETVDNQLTERANNDMEVA